MEAYPLDAHPNFQRRARRFRKSIILNFVLLCFKFSPFAQIFDRVGCALRTIELNGALSAPYELFG
jgi:hypothetical protein